MAPCKGLLHSDFVARDRAALMLASESCGGESVPIVSKDDEMLSPEPRSAVCFAVDPSPRAMSGEELVLREFSNLEKLTARWRKLS